MFPITHILAPMLAVMTYRHYRPDRITDRHVLFAGFCGILPDLLNIHIALAERASYSHSVLLLVPLAALVVVLSGEKKRYTAILTGSIGLHIVLDAASNPYNLLYPLDFTPPAYPVLSQCGLGTFFCWYSIDIALVLVFILIHYRETLYNTAQSLHR